MAATRRRLLAEVEFEGMVFGRHLTPLTTAPGHLQLDRSVYTLLTRLEVEGPMSIGQLSEAFGLDASTLNRQTAKMLSQGVVRRIPDPGGGMARKFEITDEGAEQLREDRAIKLRGLEQIVADWSADDLAELARVLRRFNESIEARDHRPWPRNPPQ